MRRALMVCVLGACLAAPARAHERHGQAPEESLAVAAAPDSTDSLAALEDAAARTVQSARVEGRDREPWRMPPMGEVVREHAHNKLVHFPIGFAIAAMLVLALGRGPRPDRAARVLVILAAIGAVLAYLTGIAQVEPFVGEPNEWVMRLHRTWGIVTGSTLVVWAVMAGLAVPRRVMQARGAVSIVLVGVAAFYGGLVAHGH